MTSIGPLLFEISSKISASRGFDEFLRTDSETDSEIVSNSVRDRRRSDQFSKYARKVTSEHPTIQQVFGLYPNMDVKMSKTRNYFL